MMQDNDSTEGRPVNSLSEGTKCVLASLLDRASELKAQAERQSEDDKAKAKAKADEDRVGGETIRAASLATFRKRKRGDETESASDVENNPSPSASKHRRLSRSSSAVRSSFEQQSSGASQQLLDLLSTHQKQQQEFQERVLTQLQENTNRCLRALEDLTAAVVQSLSR
ncbi:hypothetical protein NUW54_g7516 [Trametes sanguinea]|uniref:Uncharacterized protein n=1 Tax=Trametes sanguinea TaxID=158606 RepID=A0ACC1PN93_9APHY|nr:hypothetical protein NUW54_g7516 [Trametes sanguinea]